jgi:AraC family transcriptional regulator
MRASKRETELNGENRLSRIVHARFGRLKLVEADVPIVTHAHHHCQVTLKISGPNCHFTVRGERVPLMHDTAVLVNSWEEHAYPEQRHESSVLLLTLHLDCAWLATLHRGFAAARHPRFFVQPCVRIPDHLRNLVDRLAEGVLYADPVALDHMEQIVSAIALGLFLPFAQLRRADLPSRVREARACDARIKKAITYMQEHVESALNCTHVAAATHMSRAHFFSRFKQCTTLTPHIFANLLRMEAAIASLTTLERTIEDVSEKLGFSAPSNFARFFRQHTGISPSEYRRNVTTVSGDNLATTGRQDGYRRGVVAALRPLEVAEESDAAIGGQTL